MTKFTPGPWHLRDYARKQFVVADVPEQKPDEGFRGHIIAMETTCPQSEANLRLISAAPDLYAACEAVERELASRPDTAWFPINVRLAVTAALAAARGESND